VRLSKREREVGAHPRQGLGTGGFQCRSDRSEAVDGHRVDERLPSTREGRVHRRFGVPILAATGVSRQPPSLAVSVGDSSGSGPTLEEVGPLLLG
jgi:hypothetical protein